MQLSEALLGGDVGVIKGSTSPFLLKWYAAANMMDAVCLSLYYGSLTSVHSKGHERHPSIQTAGWLATTINLRSKRWTIKRCSDL